MVHRCWLCADVHAAPTESDAGLVVGGDRAVAAATAGAPGGDAPAGRAQAAGDGRDPAGAQDGHAVERARCDRRVQLEHGASAFSGVGAGRGVRRESGAGDCWSTTRRWGSTGSGWRATARWARRRWAVRRPAPIPLTDESEKGAKRSVLSEAAGVPIGLAHDGANRHNQRLLEPTLTSIPIPRPAPTLARPQGLCLDRGYDSPPMGTLAIEHGFTPTSAPAAKRSASRPQTPGWRARRWVVEASTPGSTATARCSSAGQRKTTTTSRC